MDMLAGYGSGSEDEPGPAPAPMAAAAAAAAAAAGVVVNPAPDVDTTGLALRDDVAVPAAMTRHLLDPKARSVAYNLPLRDMAAPLAGPTHPHMRDGLQAGLRNHRAGHVEDTHLTSFAFDEQFNTFHARGHAAAPSGRGVVGPSAARGAAGAGAGAGAAAVDSVYVSGAGGGANKRRQTAEEREQAKQRRLELQDEAQRQVAAGQPFALLNRAPWADKEVVLPEPTEEQQKWAARVAAAKAEKQAAREAAEQGLPRPEAGAAAGGAGGGAEGDAAAAAASTTTTFHGKAEKDYQGRSWLDAPRDRRRNEAEARGCFLPKRHLHTFSGHSKGVNCLRFFPETGHMLLSAGLDGKVKIWDFYGDGRKCMRTYSGHTKGVKDVRFTRDGTRFVSVGYDKNVRLWDTETGQVVRTLGVHKLFHCGVFHPDADKQHVLMAGCADKKVYQFDLRTGDVEQEYSYHLGAVNTVTFFDEGRRFVSSSDDKTLRVWEFGIPVQVKYIADPSMHSMPAVAANADNTAMLCQSLDNQILSYATKDARFKQNRKKTFKGHNTAGYACGVCFSPDGQYVTSGDANGRAFFWEWKHPGKVQRTVKAHDGVCIGVAWHPSETSKVVTCGWDAAGIKLWD